MDSKIRAALLVLQFVNVVKLPKLKEIRKRFLELSLLHHPDKNSGSQEAKSRFQEILNA